MEDEMGGWRHQLSGHETEQTQGHREVQGSLVCCSPWGHNESDTTERLNGNNATSEVNLAELWFPYSKMG